MSQSKTYELRNPHDQLVIGEDGYPTATETGVYLMLEDPESERYFTVASSRSSFKFDNWNDDLVDVTQSGIVDRDLTEVRLHEVRDFDQTEIEELDQMFEAAKEA